MKLNHGDVGLARFPHAGGSRGKKRPVVVVQADSCNAKYRHVIVAETTKNLAAASDPACMLIETSTLDGKATGLDQDSVVSCLFLATIAEDRITLIGKLSDSMKLKLKECLKLALELQ